MGKGDRVVILSENRPEWAVADYAALLLGAVVVPIYATQTAEQVLYVLQNSEARIAFVSTRQQYEKLAAIRDQTSLEYVVVMDEAPELGNAVHMRSFLRDEQSDPDPELDAIAAAIEPDDLATLIYTSGTTGTPKGVMLTHGNIASNVSVSLDMFEIGKDDLSISYLPLSHITARHLDYALQYHCITIAYCPSIDDLATHHARSEAHHHRGRAAGVREGLQPGAAQDARRKGRALQVGAVGWSSQPRSDPARGDAGLARAGSWPTLWCSPRSAKGLGGRARIFVSGGAPLGREIATWYADIGIRIHEGYGLTETSPVIAVNNPIYHRLGAVGKPLSNVEIKIAPDGELLVRGPSVFKGYWRMPDETRQRL